MKVGIYARISTSDKDQNVDTQILPLREFVSSQGWETFCEYQDQCRQLTWSTELGRGVIGRCQ